MKKRYWLLACFAPLVLSSCNFFDTLFNAGFERKTPDTLVIAVNVDRTEVQYIHSDTTHSIIRYWMDADGNRLYKSLEEHYLNQRLHGERKAWSKNGVLVHHSIWDRGLQVGTTQEWFDNDTISHFLQLNPETGLREVERFFHPNGRAMTDSIFYLAGKRNGAISYSDSLGRLVETYYYRNDTLISVKINNPELANLEARAAAIRLALQGENTMSLDSIALSGIGSSGDARLARQPRGDKDRWKF